MIANSHYSVYYDTAHSNLTLAHMYFSITIENSQVSCMSASSAWRVQLYINPCEEHVAQQIHYMCKWLLMSKHVMCILVCIDVLNIIYMHAILD